jgi:hypothetical protein
MGTLEIIIKNPSGPDTIYLGKAEWRTDYTTLQLLQGPPLVGFDPTAKIDLEFHAWVCRNAALAAGMDTEEQWEDEGFKGGRQR